MLYLSGQAPFRGHDIPFKGKLGGGVSVADGAAAARLTGLNLLYEARAALGTLDDVEAIVSIDGMVNCTSEFMGQSAVIDGCSDLLVEIFGDAGKHTRSAVGQVALAMDITTEIKMQLLVKNPEGSLLSI